MLISLEEIKNYCRIDIEEDDQLIQGLITAAEEYLKNATGKEYPETDTDGNVADYSLEKIYLQLLVAYWYENRMPGGKAGEEFNRMTKPLLLQLQLK